VGFSAFHFMSIDQWEQREWGEPKKGKRYGEAMEDNNIIIYLFKKNNIIIHTHKRDQINV